MARPYTVKVNRHVTYYDAARKPHPGTITAIGSTNSGIIIRLAHGAIVGTGAVGILRQAFTHPLGTNVWAPK